MVKNKVGGNKAKKQGRKHQTETTVSKKVRYSEDSNEIYACCEKILGGDQCSVKCIDDKVRLCMIRKKFRGRHKSDNRITIGTWLLIGKRDYQSLTKGGQEICDLLEVYRDNEKEDIKQHHPEKMWNIFKGIGASTEIPGQFDEEEQDIGIDITNKVIDTTFVDNLNTQPLDTENMLDNDSDIDFDDI